MEDELIGELGVVSVVLWVYIIFILLCFLGRLHFCWVSVRIARWCAGDFRRQGWSKIEWNGELRLRLVTLCRSFMLTVILTVMCFCCLCFCCVYVWFAHCCACAGHVRDWSEYWILRLRRPVVSRW